MSTRFEPVIEGIDCTPAKLSIDEFKPADNLPPRQLAGGMKSRPRQNLGRG
jgi:hypothetical protein